jgi:predicted helicase
VAAFSDLFARLDRDPRVRGRQFEHVCKWFLTNDPMYKTALRKVWLWKEWTGRWGIDAGIDLVADPFLRAVRGLLHAVLLGQPDN